MLKMALMVTTLLLFPAGAQAQGGPSHPKTPSVCPDANRATARPVFRALTEERLAWFRRTHGLTQVDAKQLRPLTEARSSEVCQRLNAYYATSMFGREPWKRTYFQAGGFYFASFVDTTDPTQGRPRISHFAVFDGSLKLLGILSPK